jgi:HEAT repeat protein
MKAASMGITLLTLILGASLIGVAMRANGDAQGQWDRVISNIRSSDEKVRLKAAEELPDVAFANRAATRTAEQRLVFEGQLQALVEIIRDKKEHPRVRTLVVHALLALGELGSTANLAVTSVVGVLQDEAEDDGLRCEAVMCLPYLAPPERAVPLILAAAASRSRNVRVNALEAVDRCAVDSDRLLPLLSRGVVDPSEVLRGIAASQAARLVKEKNDKRALAIVVRAAHDTQESVRQTASMLLHALGAQAKDAKLDLQSLLTDSDPTVRANAAVTLMIIGADVRKCTERISVMLRSAESPVKQAAAQSLVTCGPEARDLVPSLAGALRDPDDAVRRCAAMALINITGEADLYAPTLLQGLTEKNDFSRMWVVNAVGSLSGRYWRVLQPLLLKRLEDRDKAVRLIALELLGGLKMGPGLAIKVYSAALRDEDPELRVAGLGALARMGAVGMPALPFVREALNDPDERVREAARKAVQGISTPSPG